MSGKNTRTVLAAFCLVAMATSGCAQADLVDDATGRAFGCETAPGANPYCSDPEIRALVYEQHVLATRLANEESIELTTDMGLGISGSPPPHVALRSIRNKAYAEVRRCRAERDCILEAVQQTTEVFRGMAGLPASEPSVSEAEIAASAAGQNYTKAALVAASDAIDAEYVAEWAATRELLASPDDPDKVDPLFAFRYREPERWNRERKQRCRDDLACMAERPQILDTLIGERRRILESGAERAEIAERQTRERERAKSENAARQRENERLLAERTAALRAIEVDAILPPGSRLRPLLIEGFETFDRDVATPFATDIGNDFASAASIFGAGGMGERIRSSAIDNRRNLVAAAYGLSRRDVLGYCGDEIVEVYRRTTPGSELRTLGGVTINRSEGVDVFVRAPRRFAPFVHASHFESGEGHFADEIRRLGGCGSPVLRHVEDNLVNYARGRDFIRWNP